MKDSKNISKVLIEKDKTYLVMIRADNGKLDLPGGHCHVGESFVDGAIREVFEETMLVVDNLKEVISYERKKIFETSTFKGDLHLDIEENTDSIWMSKIKMAEFKISDCTDVMAFAAAYLNRKK